jgi:hypothetical protein
MKTQDALSIIEKTRRLLEVIRKRNSHRLAELLNKHPNLDTSVPFNQGYMAGLNAACKALDCNLDDLDVNDLIKALGDE